MGNSTNELVYGDTLALSCCTLEVGCATAGYQLNTLTLSCCTLEVGCATAGY